MEEEKRREKSAAVYACAEQMRFDVIELNAAEERGGRRVLQRVLEATQSRRMTTQSGGGALFDTLEAKPKPKAKAKPKKSTVKPKGALRKAGGLGGFFAASGGTEKAAKEPKSRKQGAQKECCGLRGGYSPGGNAASAQHVEYDFSRYFGRAESGRRGLRAKHGPRGAFFFLYNLPLL